MLRSLPLVFVKGSALKDDMNAIQRGLRQDREFYLQCSTVPDHVQMNPNVSSAGKVRSVPGRASKTSPVCVKVSAALNLLDTQRGRQVFPSDVINHSPHNTLSM